MEVMAIGKGGKSPVSVLSLYIMGLYAEGRLSLDDEPSRDRVRAEIEKDLQVIFEPYEKLVSMAELDNVQE
jgi:hypothetical protein